MRIVRVDKEKRCRNPADFPKPGMPEIAFAGRSNVGKSSLINSLLNRKGLVKVSGEPGKTRSIDFFLINDRLRLVDLPGYGYARVSNEMRAGWKSLIESYLREPRRLVSVVWILDVRREVGTLDRMLEGWLRAYAVPYIPVCTKADKIPFGQRPARLRSIAATLAPEMDPLLYSSRTGLGKAALWKRIREAVSAGAPEQRGGAVSPAIVEEPS